MSTPDARTASPSALTNATGVLPDEAALKRAFDAEFPQALASAKSQLGEAATLAPRVVETAFVNTWGQRATLGNHEHLKSVLSDEIRHGAARALSRRHSGARFGAVGGAHAKAHDMGADHESAAHVWSQVEKALHGSGTTAEARAATAAAGRHEAAAHMKRMSKRPGWVIPVAIGVIALAISVGGVLYVDRLGEDDAVLGLVANQSIQPIQSAAGQIGTTKLGDGSSMSVGPDTRVWIPDGFATKNRALKVEGTAAFDVAPGQQMPFRVVSRRNHFIATGTKFVISTLNKDTIPMLFVQEGAVTVKSGKNVLVVNAGQAVSADQTKGINPLTDDEKAEAFGWVDKRVIVRNKQLRNVLAALTRWYNYDIKVADLRLLDRPASLDASLDSSKTVIAQVEKNANLKFGFEGENRVFRDAAPGAAKSPKKK
jgi:ferric-dicitrate binding protein FerR (iron transport regulator)